MKMFSRKKFFDYQIFCYFFVIIFAISIIFLVTSCAVLPNISVNGSLPYSP